MQPIIEDIPAESQASQGNWHNASGKQPCPICHKSDWCSLNTSGTAAICRRTLEKTDVPGWNFAGLKTDEGGQDFTVWEIGDEEAITDGVVPAPPPKPKVSTAPPKILNLIYSKFRDNLNLPQAPWCALQKRGLSRPELRLRQYAYLDEQRKKAVKGIIAAGLEKYLKSIPGFYTDKKGSWQFAGPRGIVVSVRNTAGRIVALKIRVDKPVNDRKYVYASSRKHGGAGPGAPVHVPLHDENIDLTTVRITEGELKADVATARTGILTLGLPGVGMHAKVVPILKKLGAKTAKVAFDSDFREKPAVAAALAATIRELRPDFKVLVEVWSPVWGKGIDDILAAGHNPKTLRGGQIDKLLDQLAKVVLGGKLSEGLAILRDQTTPPEAKRPTIEITTEEMQVNNQAVAALAGDTSIYTRGGVLVHMLPDDGKDKMITRPVGSPRVVPLPLAVLREHLAAAALWQEEGHGKKLIPAHPPEWSCKAVFSRGYWPGLRPLVGIVSGTLRADGTILATPGYDPATGLICEIPCQIPPIAEHPSCGNTQAAKDALLHSVVDFPFEKESHRAGWVAFVLTLVARFAFIGPSPLFLVDANTRGSGKGLLCDLAAIIATGRPMPRTSSPSSDEEARKRITALAISADTVVLIDNISGSLGGSSLEAAITAVEWRDRLLGHSEIVTLPLFLTWCATGNNVMLTGDMPRRVVHIRLNSPMENPEERSGFQHPNLIQWATEQRGVLLSAALTLLRGYLRRRASAAARYSLGQLRGLVGARAVDCGMGWPPRPRRDSHRGCRQGRHRRPIPVGPAHRSFGDRPPRRR